MNTRIAVLGAGSWGATLASVLEERGHEVTLWEFDPEQAKQLASWRALKFFQYLTIPKDILITSDLKAACENKDAIFFVVPSHTLRGVAEKISSLNLDLSRTIIVTATKGIENGTLLRMSEVIDQCLPGHGPVVSLSGPTHAEEVAQKMPTIITAASADAGAARLVQEYCMSSYFRVYTHSDIVGAETGGALKNIFALAAGICDGLGYGDNTKAALATRGLRELIRLGVAMGGKEETFFGLTGIGDLMVTAFSRHSRNRSMGEKIGKGKSLPDAEKELIMVAEGVRTTRSAWELAQRYGLEVPIIEQVYRVLYEGKPPREAVLELMMREPKPE